MFAEMDEVYPRLFVGSLTAANNSELLCSNKITHILTVEYSPLPEEHTKDYTYLYIHADDDPEQDLLSHFPTTNKFITEALDGGGKSTDFGVLVHCFVGVSRSATIAAAYIMQKEKLAHGQVIDNMRKKRFVSPNQGFLMQLRCFEQMNFQIDERDEDFKVYRLKKYAVKMKYKSSQKRFPEHFYALDPFADDNDVKPSTSDVDVVTASLIETHIDTNLIYKCSKCRRPLFTDESKLSHKKGMGEMAFDWRGQLLKQLKNKSKEIKPDVTEHKVCNDSYFIEPVNWMKEAISELRGKLLCPKCLQKVGAFNWSGEMCTCGSFVTPAFHIHKTKVDRCDMNIAKPELKD